MSDHGKGSDVWHLQRNLANANATIAAKDTEIARLRKALEDTKREWQHLLIGSLRAFASTEIARIDAALAQKD